MVLGACGKSEPAPPRDGGVIAIDAAGHFVRAEFCAAVFPLAEVAKIVGGALEERTRVDGEVPNMATCLYESGAKDEPDVRVHLMVDCRDQSLDVGRLKEMAETMAGSDGEFRAIDLGKGGAKAYVPRMKARSIAFVHAEVPCAVSISIEPGTLDVGDALAAIAARRLSPQTRPR